MLCCLVRVNDRVLVLDQMIQNCEPLLIAAQGKTPTVPRRSLKSATSQLGDGGYLASRVALSK